MENEVINTLQDGERVTSTYAEVYFDDDHCDHEQLTPDSDKTFQAKSKPPDEQKNDWVSPSDLLIGIIDLKPPFTSKITRGKTHEGILSIGNDLIAKERANFLKYLANLIYENDCAWNHIIEFEKATVVKKVKEIYKKIFEKKSKCMIDEITSFYEETIQDVEKNIKIQVDDVLVSTHADIISKLNIDIKKKLKIEKNRLEKVLKKRYRSEVAKLKKYYKLLLDNENHRSKYLINKVIDERNDAVKAFLRQIEAENTTSTMYVMCTERKKCRIKQFILENYQSRELKEKYQKLKEKQDVIESFKEREKQFPQINSEWEDKIKKILQLFLKFISFSMKLLPEQSLFLLNFEKMVVLQLNEMQNMHKVSSILIEDENYFKFEKMKDNEEECTKEPFVITGGYLSGTPSTEYGSTETIPDDADVPAVRLQRQFIYAKCHRYEEVKAKLEADRCKCLDQPKPKEPPKLKPCTCIFPPKSEDRNSEGSITASFEHLLVDDIHRRNQCPGRNCQKWFDSYAFPNLSAYLDFDDEKYEKVVTILSKLPEQGATPDFIDPKEIIYRELPFAATKEPYHNVETQYSSQEDINIPDITCQCLNDYVPQRYPSHHRLQETRSEMIASNMAKRKISLRRLLQQNPRIDEYSYSRIF